MLGAALAGAGQPLAGLPPRPIDTVLADVIARTAWRAPADKAARPPRRHPVRASLRFWGLKPGRVVIDVNPGTGWWTDILAPYLARTGGHYIAAVAEP